MIKILLNAYFVLCLCLIGPEAVAKSLPMKKVQTVETVWVPMDPGEVEQVDEVIEAVELPEGQQGAVPLFKESQVEVPDVPAQENEAVVAKEIPEGVQVQTPPGGKQPIIQVIYQGVHPPKKSAPVIAQPLAPPVVVKPKPKKIRTRKPAKKTKKKKGDTYNFYFRS